MIPGVSLVVLGVFSHDSLGAGVQGSPRVFPPDPLKRTGVTLGVYL